MKNDDNEFFKSRTDQLAFYLLQISGEEQIRLLGITPFHYQNKEYATKWFSDTMAEVDMIHPRASEIIAKLTVLHSQMIQKG